MLDKHLNQTQVFSHFESACGNLLLQFSGKGSHLDGRARVSKGCKTCWISWKWLPEKQTARFTLARRSPGRNSSVTTVPGISGVFHLGKATWSSCWQPDLPNYSYCLSMQLLSAPNVESSVTLPKTPIHESHQPTNLWKKMSISNPKYIASLSYYW